LPNQTLLHFLNFPKGSGSKALKLSQQDTVTKPWKQLILRH